MDATMADPALARHRVIPETASAMAKADLRKAEMVTEWRARVGAAVIRTRQLSGLNLNQFADQIGRDVRQVGRWETGQERAQIDAIFAVDALRQPLVQALSEVAGADVEVVVRLRRSA